MSSIPNPIVVPMTVAVNDVTLPMRVSAEYYQPISLQTLEAGANGGYTAPNGTAWNEAHIDVPNSYTAADEGKVVHGGALVAQTSRTVTENRVFDTTLNNSVTVDVPLSFLGRNVNLHLYEVTVGENNVSNTLELVNYLFSLTGQSGTFNVSNLIIGLLDEIELVNDMVVGTGFYDSGQLAQNTVWRYRSGEFRRVQISTAFDAVAIKGTHYFVCWTDGRNSV